MKALARKGVLVTALGALTCGLMVSGSANADQKDSSGVPSADTTDNPSMPAKGWSGTFVTKAASGDEGGIAGAELWNNGPVITPGSGLPPAGSTCTTGDFSALQNTTLCNTTFGYSGYSNAAGTTTFNLVDDFALTGCSQLSQFEYYLYQTGAAAPNVASATVRVHTGLPHGVGSNLIGSVTQTTAQMPVAPAFTNTFRATLNTTAANACTRRLVRVVVDLSSIPPLPAGTYWISYTTTLGGGASYFFPPTTVLGQQAGSANGNARQTPATGGLFSIKVVDGLANTAGCVNSAYLQVAQDFPFIVRGAPSSSCTGGPCLGNVNTSGASANSVDIDDLLDVIGAWGPCPIPTNCPADVFPIGVGDDVVNIDDLLTVIGAWGPCPPSTPPGPTNTGACCLNSGSCTDGVTFAACLAAGGFYQGDNSVCSSITCPVAPANDNCGGAIPLTLASSPFTANNAAATTLDHNLVGLCFAASTAVGGAGQRDLWYSFTNTTGSAINLVIDTVASTAVTDTYLQVFSSCGGTQIACNDDIGGGVLLSNLTAPVANGETVLIRVGTWGASTPGDIVLQLNVQP